MRQFFLHIGEKIRLLGGKKRLLNHRVNHFQVSTIQVAMKHVSILIPGGAMPHNTVISVVGAYKVFSVANEFHRCLGRSPVFEIILAGERGRARMESGKFSIETDTDFRKIKKTDLIMIPPTGLDEDTLRMNEIFVPWIRKHYSEGTEIASICTGAFLLATTGLLDGKECSTHWKAAERFRQLFPRVNLVTDQLITDASGIYTNGGAYSFLNLILYLVEKYCGRETAIYCAKAGEIDFGRNSQSPFHIFTPQKHHDDESVRAAQEFIENNISEKISIDDMARRYGLSRRNFERRFKKATADTPLNYVQRVKIEYAKKNFEGGNKNVNEVMYDTGYCDRKAFRTAFKKVTGLLPHEYRKKYNRRDQV